MQAYILSVCGAVIISALVTLLLPEGKTGKFINGILKLFCLLVVLVPLFGFFKELKNPGFPDSSQEASLDDGFIDYAFAVRAKEDGEKIDKTIADEFSVVVSSSVAWDFVEYSYKITGVSVKIKNFGMYGNDEHIIIIDKIARRVSELTDLPLEEVNVYE